VPCKQTRCDPGGHILAAVRRVGRKQQGSFRDTLADHERDRHENGRFHQRRGQPPATAQLVLIYMQRAASSSKFSLDLTNWQPTVLSAFIVATKLAFDEPVWNEDFADGLRTDVPLSQISRWESDFLEIIEYNANVKFAQYAALCFELQARYETLARPSSRTRGGAHFFTYLMRQPTPRHAPLECRRPYRLPHGPAGLLPAVAPEYPPSDTHPRK